MIFFRSLCAAKQKSARTLTWITTSKPSGATRGGKRPSCLLHSEGVERDGRVATLSAASQPDRLARTDLTVSIDLSVSKFPAQNLLSPLYSFGVLKRMSISFYPELRFAYTGLSTFASFGGFSSVFCPTKKFGKVFHPYFAPPKNLEGRFICILSFPFYREGHFKCIFSYNGRLLASHPVRDASLGR